VRSEGKFGVSVATAASLMLRARASGLCPYGIAGRRRPTGVAHRCRATKTGPARSRARWRALTRVAGGSVALQPFTPLFVNNLAWVRSLPEPRSDAP
jgi:hypothetical protein